MQFVRYTAGGGPTWGVRRDDEIVPLDELREEVSPAQLTDDGFLRLARRDTEAAADRALDADERQLLAPVPRPGKIVCVGLNYHDHAEEKNEPVPERPLLFGKAPTAVTNPGSPIVHPDGIEEVDYEVELGVVIGRTVSGVSEADTRDCVAEYTAINDVSARWT